MNDNLSCFTSVYGMKDSVDVTTKSMVLPKVDVATGLCNESAFKLVSLL